jgi:hypothetical protein
MALFNGSKGKSNGLDIEAALASVTKSPELLESEAALSRHRQLYDDLVARRGRIYHEASKLKGHDGTAHHREMRELNIEVEAAKQAVADARRERDRLMEPYQTSLEEALSPALREGAERLLQTIAAFEHARDWFLAAAAKAPKAMMGTPNAFASAGAWKRYALMIVDPNEIPIAESDCIRSFNPGAPPIGHNRRGGT